MINPQSLQPLILNDAALEPYTRLMNVREDGKIAARLADFQIRSAFQPIYSYAHMRPVGYEALARANDASGRPVNPAELFGSARSADETIYLDRLLRAVHVGNFVEKGSVDSWLFLNISPIVVVYGTSQGPFFKEMLAAFNLPPHRVVVEITETGAKSEDDLERAACYYREIGCLVAIDDFGAGHSNFTRIWNLKPDIIKLDRVLIQKAAADPTASRSLGRIVGLLHEFGALVVAEGIETEKEALIAVNANADLLQGFYFAKPAEEPRACPSYPQKFSSLQRIFADQMHDVDADFRLLVKSSVAAFARAAERLAHTTDLTAATQEMIELPGLQRFFLLDGRGTQIGENISPSHFEVAPDSRHLPLRNAEGANWMHRPYFRRAVANPGAVQITRPYLSITDARMCITLSVAIETLSGKRVLCCDIGTRFNN